MLGKGSFKQIRNAIDAVQAAPDPLVALDAARRLREEAEALELRLVLEARSRRATWTEIGTVYGTSKQGAQQRFRSAVLARQSEG